MILKPQQIINEQLQQQKLFKNRSNQHKKNKTKKNHHKNLQVVKKKHLLKQKKLQDYFSQSGSFLVEQTSESMIPIVGSIFI